MNKLMDWGGIELGFGEFYPNYPNNLGMFQTNAGNAKAEMAIYFD